VTGVAPEDGTSGEFGANEWLVDEMYERYRVDKNSVDKSWWPILESYRPVDDPTPTQAHPGVGDASRPTRSAQGAGGRRGPDPEAVTEAPAAPAAPSRACGGDRRSPTGTTPIARTTSIPAKPQPIPAQAPATGTTVVPESTEPPPSPRRPSSSSRA
jgi:2-oxoglutarate dehydrogenase E1 component